MRVTIRILQAVAFFAVVGGMIGFASFAGRVSNLDPPQAPLSADAIVVLTGDSGRLRAGSELLRSGSAPRLLISGVHDSVSNADILRQTTLEPAAFDCCVTLDRRADDTVGNARETANWARSNSYNRLIIVTSDYHLPRSLLEMKRAMPNVDLIAYPVPTSPPWETPATTRLWVQEYAKFATVWMGSALLDDGENA